MKLNQLPPVIEDLLVVPATGYGRCVPNLSVRLSLQKLGGFSPSDTADISMMFPNTRIPAVTADISQACVMEKFLSASIRSVSHTAHSFLTLPLGTFRRFLLLFFPLFLLFLFHFSLFHVSVGFLVRTASQGNLRP